MSTRASTSTAGCSWISTSSWASFTAATAKAIVVISASPCGTIDATEDTATTRASRHAPVANAACHPPTACICPLSTTATIGTSAQLSHRTTCCIPARSSEKIGRKVRASAAREAAWEREPTALRRTRPDPPVTEEPDSTVSPGLLVTGSFSPVSRDSSRSSPSAVRTSPSAGT